MVIHKSEKPKREQYIYCLQHAPFEGPGCLEEQFAELGHRLNIVHVYNNEKLPVAQDISGLVILGGPMSVNEESLHPWLIAEKELIRKTLDCETPVLGICLGAQLIAAALGAEVRQNPEKEIGWFPVQIDLLSAANPLLAGLPATIIPLHWHGETFDLPPGAQPFASSPACRNQGFTIGSQVLAMQFHLEFTKLSLDSLMENCPEDLAPGPWVQTIAEISGAQGNFTVANSLMATLLSNLFPKNG